MSDLGVSLDGGEGIAVGARDAPEGDALGEAAAPGDVVVGDEAVAACQTVPTTGTGARAGAQRGRGAGGEAGRDVRETSEGGFDADGEAVEPASVVGAEAASLGTIMDTAAPGGPARPTPGRAAALDAALERAFQKTIDEADRRRTERAAQVAKRPRKKCQKVNYHHGGLEEAAIRRGIEIVQMHGPAALTMRGLARALGVSATALVYYFGHVAGMRGAVAARIGDGLDAVVKPARVGAPLEERLAVPGTAWIRYAAEEPNEFRFRSGEGWARASNEPRNMMGFPDPIPPPEHALRWRSARVLRHRARAIPPEWSEDETAVLLAAAARGLVLATFNGLPIEMATRMYEGLARREAHAWTSRRAHDVLLR